MKRLLVCSAVLLFIGASLCAAADFTKGKKQYMGVCGERDKGDVYSITNAGTLNSCATDGASGALTALCQCSADGLGGYEWTSMAPVAAETPDLSAYVPVTKAGQQTITATGAGNDITLDAADRLIVNIPVGSLFKIENGTSAAIGTDTEIGSGYFQFWAYDGSQTMQYEMSAAGTYLSGTGDGSEFAIDIGTGSGELTVQNNRLFLGTTTLLVPAAGSAPPATCVSGIKGAYYFDNELLENCTCNGTDWKKNSDATTTCS